MSILTAIGLLLLTISLGGVVLGLYMAADSKTRARGVLFAVLWLPAVGRSERGPDARRRNLHRRACSAFWSLAAVFILEGDKLVRAAGGEKERPGNRVGGKRDYSTPRRPPKRPGPRVRVEQPPEKLRPSAYACSTPASQACQHGASRLVSTLRLRLACHAPSGRRLVRKSTRLGREPAGQQFLPIRPNGNS